MPKFFFNIHHEKPGVDAIGEDLPDKDAAWKEATLIAGELFKDMDGNFQPGTDWSIEVTDERRNPLYLIRVSAEEI